jgi:hypothetical protein
VTGELFHASGNVHYALGEVATDASRLALVGATVLANADDWAVRNGGGLVGHIVLLCLVAMWRARFWKL